MTASRPAAELISHYGTYTDAGDLNMSALSEAPATSIPCFIASPTTVTITTVLSDPEGAEVD